MLNVLEILAGVPTFEKFCSVRELQGLAEELRSDSRFAVAVSGSSTAGRPIHHIRFGSGSLKALVVGFPHANEPIGGLTTFSLLTLLRQGSPELLSLDVEWNIVPCIDPDAATLNEGWTQRPFTLDTFLMCGHRQEFTDQVECSFPIRHKGLVFDRPTKEAHILQRILQTVAPDFYYSLHNSYPGAGGTWFIVSHPLPQRHYDQLYDLLNQHGLPLRTDMPYGAFCEQFAPGIKEPTYIKRYYDFLEQTDPHPWRTLTIGACSWDFLAEIKPSATTFVAELCYLKHPSDGSSKLTDQNLRRLKLRVDADNKFLITLVIEAWDEIEDDLEQASPFYRKIRGGIIAARDNLNDGLSLWPFKTREILFSPHYGKLATEGERFNVFFFDRLVAISQCHEFLRLLDDSRQTAAVVSARARLAEVFSGAIEEMNREIDFSQLDVIDCTTLAKVQLGSGLIVLSALLEGRTPTESHAGR